jgi:hypothetical protein
VIEGDCQFADLVVAGNRQDLVTAAILNLPGTLDQSLVS